MTDHTPAAHHSSDPSDPPRGDRGAARHRTRRNNPSLPYINRSTTGPLPDPIGDVVPGDPPVPITVWHLPRPRCGQLASADMVRWLVGNHTRPGDLVVDLTVAGKLPPADHPVALVITGWPEQPDAVPAHVAGCAGGLQPGGCVAVVLPTTRTPEQLGQVVAAGRAAGLTYLQHIVVAHQLTPYTPTADGRRRAHPGVERGGPRPRVHTDVLILRAPVTSRSSADA